MDEHKRSWLEKLSSLFSAEPGNRDELIHVLREAEEHKLLDAEALSMMEGVLEVNEMRVTDIMVPRSQMIVIEKQQMMKHFLPLVIESNHSRFPVYDHELDNIIGVLLAKDLLPYLLDRSKLFDIREILRPSFIIPESKRLNTLLREFRSSKNHMAIVVDEYGHVAGLITIEDVLEQIVGEIHDEHDIEDESCIKKHSEQEYIVKAMTPMTEFNEYFTEKLAPEDCDTIGGLVLKHFGHVPKRDESLSINNYHFSILSSDARRIKMLKVERIGTPKDV